MIEKPYMMSSIFSQVKVAYQSQRPKSGTVCLSEAPQRYADTTSVLAEWLCLYIHALMLDCLQALFAKLGLQEYIRIPEKEQLNADWTQIEVTNSLSGDNSEDITSNESVCHVSIQTQKKGMILNWDRNNL